MNEKRHEKLCRQKYQIRVSAEFDKAVRYWVFLTRVVDPFLILLGHLLYP